MTTIAIIADSDTRLAFALGGVSGRSVHSAREAQEAIAALVSAAHRSAGSRDAVGLLLVTHTVASWLRERLDTLMLDPSGPIVLEIPAFAESGGQGPVQKFVERVLGLRL